MKKLLDRFQNWIETINAFFLVLLSLTLFTRVLARYVFSESIPETEIFQKLSIAWLVFLGAAVAVKGNEHLQIDIFSDFLHPKLVYLKNILVYVLTLAAICILVVVGWKALEAGLGRTELVQVRFLSSPPSLAYYFSAVLVGAVLMLIFHLINIKQFFNSRKGQ
ncbi:TRAP transporter small permease [Salibacterium lacus]|uniref:TRAP transporter small permease n=1 Tax=Salibacterium lacus TaxID=1898109 RepID=A0ABW5T406_9BACI